MPTAEREELDLTQCLRAALKVVREQQEQASVASAWHGPDEIAHKGRRDAGLLNAGH